MPKAVLDHDAETGTTEIMHFEKDGRQIIETIQDCTDVVEYNRSLEGNLDKKKDWWHIGSIPLATCQKWAQESGTRVFSKEWQEIAKRNMNLPEYRKLNPNRVRV